MMEDDDNEKEEEEEGEQDKKKTHKNKIRGSSSNSSSSYSTKLGQRRHKPRDMSIHLLPFISPPPPPHRVVLQYRHKKLCYKTSQKSLFTL